MYLTKFLSQILQKISRALVVNSNEPQVTHKKDRLGNSYWQAYDRKTNKTYTFGTEQGIRSWLDKRYHCI